MPFPIIWQGHISDWSDPNSDLPLERTVFENRGRGERQGRVSYKCHIQQLLCVQWHLNWNRRAQQGTGFKIFFFLLHTSERLSCWSWSACWCVTLCINRAAMEFAGPKASVLFGKTVLPCCIVIWYCTIKIQDTALKTAKLFIHSAPTKGNFESWNGSLCNKQIGGYQRQRNIYLQGYRNTRSHAHI